MEVVGDDMVMKKNGDNFFFQRCNPVTGKSEWKVENEDDYDYFKDIARSSYADMLHDTERNHLYYEGIKLAVKHIHNQGKVAKVLDIGTGTGLLSMMAAKAGAEVINAIEMFTPMAKVARRIVKANGFSHINIINKHSTEVKFGEDIKEKCNIIITELFDTELIGEGALGSYQHAHENFMEEGCVAVPHRALVYAQVVQSELMSSWNELKPISCRLPSSDGNNPADEVRIEPDPQMSNGIGLSTVHDIQMTQITRDDFVEVSAPVKIFEFDWSSRSLCTTSKRECLKLQAETNGRAEVVLSWWDLEMFQNSDIVLSTSPKWLHPDPDNMQWRDHWIQSIYFLPNAVQLKKHDHFMLKAFHDDYTMWFEAYEADRGCEEAETIILPMCSYPPRALLSRPRMGMINDAERNQVLVASLDAIASPSKRTALCLGDFSLLPLLLAKCGKFEGRVIAHERSKIAQRGLYNMSRHNRIDAHRITFIYADTLESLSEKLHGEKIDMLVSEPFFFSSHLPWHNLYFWYARTHLAPQLTADCSVMPYRAHLCACALSLRDLWKIRAPVGRVENFDISLMDAMIDRALERREHYEAEPHHLWEYPNKLLTASRRIITFDFSAPVPDHVMSCEGRIPFAPRPSPSSSSTNDFPARHCHAVALWLEYDLTPDAAHKLSTGLLGAGEPDAAPEWSKHHKQAVYFLKHPFDVTDNPNEACINYKIDFHPQHGDVITDFDIN